MLVNDATVSGVVGTRVYPLVAPPNAATPFISYHNIRTEAYNKLSGAPDADNKEFEIGCVAEDFATALELSRAVRDALGTQYGYLHDQGVEYYEKTQEFRVWLHWSLIG